MSRRSRLHVPGGLYYVVQRGNARQPIFSDASDYATFEQLARRGAWIQVTAGAVTGRFGRRAKYWGERFLGEGITHILATDAHHPDRRPPLLGEAREAAARLLGEAEATHLVSTRPQGIVDNLAPDDMPPLPGPTAAVLATREPSFWQRLRGAA